MSDIPSTPGSTQLVTPEALLAHALFVRNVARRLTRDRAEAEDVEQPT